MRRVTLFSLVLMSLAAGECFGLPSFPLFGNFSSTRHARNGEVFVATENLLLRLDNQLTLLDMASFDGKLLQLAISPNSKWLVICVQTSGY